MFLAARHHGPSQLSGEKRWNTGICFTFASCWEHEGFKQKHSDVSVILWLSSCSCIYCIYRTLQEQTNLVHSHICVSVFLFSQHIIPFVSCWRLLYLLFLVTVSHMQQRPHGSIYSIFNFFLKSWLYKLAVLSWWTCGEPNTSRFYCARWLWSCENIGGRNLAHVEAWAWLGSYLIGTRHVLMVGFLQSYLFERFKKKLSNKNKNRESKATRTQFYTRHLKYSSPCWAFCFLCSLCYAIISLSAISPNDINFAIIWPMIYQCELYHASLICRLYWGIWQTDISYTEQIINE